MAYGMMWKMLTGVLPQKYYILPLNIVAIIS